MFKHYSYDVNKKNSKTAIDLDGQGGNCIDADTPGKKTPWKTWMGRHAFNFDGSQVVSTKPMTENSFSVHAEDKIAEYDESVIRKYFNKGVILKSLKSRMIRRLKHGVMKRTFPIIAIWILLYYMFSIYIFMTVCHKQNETKKSDSIVVHFLQPFDRTDNNSHFCKNYIKDKGGNESWMSMENNMTNILTFLIGFYVSFIVGSYWTSLAQVPTVANVCIGLGAYIVTSPSVDEDKYGITLENVWISLKQYKKDIIRLSLIHI